MNKIIVSISFVVLSLFMPFTGWAQSKCDFSLGADFVSSYIWRGMYLSGTSIQPDMGMEIGGFSIGAWGSIDISNTGYKEVDLVAGYSLGGFYFGLSDYWVSEEDSYNYFDFKKNETSHTLEVNLIYSFPTFPLSLSWNTMVAGNDQYLNNNGKLKQAFSTYVEAAYAFSVKDINLDVALGASPWNSRTQYTTGYTYATNNFAVVNISLKAAKDIQITENYSLGVFGQLVFNPAKDDAFFVFGINF